MSCTDSGGSLSLAVTAAVALAQGRTEEEITRMAMFFTVLGDSLALLALLYTVAQIPYRLISGP